MNTKMFVMHVGADVILLLIGGTSSSIKIENMIKLLCSQYPDLDASVRPTNRQTVLWISFDVGIGRIWGPLMWFQTPPICSTFTGGAGGATKLILITPHSLSYAIWLITPALVITVDRMAGELAM